MGALMLHALSLPLWQHDPNHNSQRVATVLMFLSEVRQQSGWALPTV